MRQNESNSPVTHIITLIDKKKKMPPPAVTARFKKNTLLFML